jgi:hydroxyacylglutathione hydrolase
MFLHTLKSKGLAHLSYMFGDGAEAAVVDARRDCDAYLELARQEGVRITHIFETHRNEDYITGSSELARRTGATIHHGAGLDFEYGSTVSEGDTFEFGNLRLSVLSTPGHTFESISLVLADTAFSEGPVAVFTGDALFIGDVGRTDFFPDRAEEVAGLLYDSIFEKLLPLGDHVLLYPAHGAGSVCGGGLAEREFSSLGFERKHNPVLQLSERDDFIRHKVNETHYKPPYFKKMEQYNLKGNAPAMDRLPEPTPVDAGAFSEAMKNGMVVLDTREPEAVAGACVPGSLAIPLDMIPAYAGWFLPYEKPIGLVVHDPAEIPTAVRHLVRLGYDTVAYVLKDGLHGWATSGRPFERIGAAGIDEVKAGLEDGKTTLLDVRKLDEWEEGHLPGATHIYLGHLSDRIDEIPKDRRVVTFCGSGRRAVIAASILKKHGYEQVADHLGSMEAWKANGLDVEQE